MEHMPVARWTGSAAAWPAERGGRKKMANKNMLPLGPLHSTEMDTRGYARSPSFFCLPPFSPPDVTPRPGAMLWNGGWAREETQHERCGALAQTGYNVDRGCDTERQHASTGGKPGTAQLQPEVQCDLAVNTYYLYLYLYLYLYGTIHRLQAQAASTGCKREKEPPSCSFSSLQGSPNPCPQPSPGQG